MDEVHRALDLAERFQLRWLSVQILEFLALVASDEGDLERAGRLLGACEAFRADNGFTFRWENPQRGVDQLLPRLDAVPLAGGFAMSIDEAVAYARGNRGERGRPSFGWEALTPAEVRVVDYVSEGLSNKQIAEKLFITVATVKTHLVHVYQKLELSSRSELIATALSPDRH